jgi:hypothetical protein
VISIIALAMTVTWRLRLMVDSFHPLSVAHRALKSKNTSS